MVIAALSLLVAQATTPLAEMDFELVNGHIYVPGTINGNPVNVILDSGAGMSVMDLALADRLKLASSGELQANGIGKDSVKGKYLKDSTIRFGGIDQKVQIAIPLGSLTEAEGRSLDNVVGYELFVKSIIQIDYAGRKVRIYAKDSGFQPKGTPADIRVIGNHPHLKSSMKIGAKTYDLETMVDTGASGGGLTTKFLSKNPLSVTATPKAVIGGGVGGFIEGQFFRPEYLTIAGHTAKGPVVSMTDSAGGASGATSNYDLLLGSDVLKRFTVTFDYSRSKMYFEPNADLGKPFEADKTGLRLFATLPDMQTFRVMGVLKGSAAEVAGLQKDDVIETIDGKPAGSMKLYKWREQFRSADAKGWEFGVRRGGELLKIRVNAKSVI